MTNSDFCYGHFPQGFMFGMANSSYQTEGAWNLDGKGESVWDRFTHEDPSRITDRSNGDVAMDSYHKYKEDIKLLKSMNAKMYRFSISWPRLLPKGTMEVVNQAGIDYYNKLIDELIAHEIEPCVTLFHWDLPQGLQDLGGWGNQELVQFFGEYARLCFSKFGDRVRYWITLNELYVYVTMGYNFGVFAPGIKEPLEAPYKAAHTMLLSHGLAYAIYKKEFKQEQKGKIGISIDSSHYAPLRPDSKEDLEAVDKAYQFRIGWIANPLINGDYPDIMKDSIEAQSKLEGRGVSRLPAFDPTSSSMLKGSFDFIGLNYYTSELVTPLTNENKATSTTDNPGWDRDLGIDRIASPNGRECGISWQRDVPTGLRTTLNWIKKEYGNPTVIITENGMAEQRDALDDEGRVTFFRGHINETLKAVLLDGCNVVGFLGWCLLDVFEWSSGYSIGFGVHHVDLSSPELERTPKKSAQYLKQIFTENGFKKPS